MKNVLNIDIEMYRMNLIVAWDIDVEKVMKWTNRRGCKITDAEIKKAKETSKERVDGFVTRLGNDNVDLLLWLKKKPEALQSHGALWHELHHVVFMMAEDRSMQSEMEAQAYLYEYLCLKCCDYFWRNKQKKLKK